MYKHYLAQINFDQIKSRVFPSGSLPAEANTLGDILSRLLPYVYAVAGLMLFIILIIGGFGYLTSGGDPKKVEMAQGKITHALMGFLIIFLSYWLAQLLEIIFGIQIF